MRKKRLLAVLFVTIGLMAAGAQATDFTGAYDTDWFNANNWTAGVPDANTPANIGTSGTGSVSVTITGTANAGRTIVSASGGASVTGSMTISAGSTLNTWGSFFNTDEGEVHGFDIGGMAAGNLTLEANASLIMKVGDSMGLGKDDRWHYDGFDTHIIMKPGSSITVGAVGTGWAAFGLGDGNASQIMEMENATINGILFHIGGTLILKGRDNVQSYSTMRFREYSNPPGTIIKLVGDVPLLSGPSGLQLRGPRVDVSDCNKPANGVWVDILKGTGGTDWPDKDINFVPGTPPEWEMRIVHPMPSGSERKVQIRYNLLVGDMDLSGAINADDINPFVLAMTDPNAYITTYGKDPNVIGDCNGSGKLDTDDITPFVVLVTGGQAIPEPACLALLGLGSLAILRRRRK